MGREEVAQRAGGQPYFGGDRLTDAAATPSRVSPAIPLPPAPCAARHGR